jgi:DNA-binding CsgD family transcriptional regulator
MDDRSLRVRWDRAGPLLEREHELALLTEAIQAASRGDAGLTLLRGEPGLGKTSLVEWVGARAREREFTVLSARGGRLERTLGWGVSRQLFEQHVIGARASVRRSLLRGSAALAAPVLGLAAGESAPASPVKDFSLEHGLYWLVCNMAERRPIALLIDDAQWCDDATLEWLLYLARRSERLPLAIVLATRSGEPDAPETLLELIASEPIARTVVLSALGVESTETLVGRAYGVAIHGEFGRACYEWTGGNPLFVTELAAGLAAEGVDPVDASAPRVRTLTPSSVSRVVLLRLSRLSADALELARAIAVLESSADLRPASDLAGLDAAAAHAALDELIAARVLRSGPPLRFAHPLIGGVVYGDIAPAHRATMHKQAARLLLAADVDPGRVSAHLLRSTAAGEEWVTDVLRRAAQHDLARGSPSTAAELLRRALSEAPATLHPALMLELGQAELLSGDTAGIETLRRALEASEDALERGRIAILLGRLLLGSDSGAATVEVARAVAEEVGWADPDLRLQLEALIVNAARSGATLVPLIGERLRAVRDHAGDDTHGGRLIAAQLSWGLTAIAAPAETAVALARRALGEGRLIREAPDAPDSWLGAIHMLSFNDELEEADSLFEEAITVAQGAGSLPAFSASSCFRANAAYLRGDLDRAELLARDALRLSSDTPALALIDGLATAYLAIVLATRGSIAEALALLPPAPAELEGSPATWATESMYAAGLAVVAAGDTEAGAALLLGCGRRALAWGVITPAWIPWRSASALALQQIGEETEAVRLSEEELVLAERCGARRPVGIALRARGLIEGGEAGLALLRRSAELLAASPARLEHARTLVALGGALRRANARAEARDRLSHGLALAEQAGAGPLVEEARRELVAIGARPRSVMRTGADALTASERRVCELAAEGKSNPEIAQLLFVTRATVESHLHSAYRRLDITSRKQLAEALAATSATASAGS